MAPFEALYGRRCRSPIGWVKISEAKFLGLDFVQDSIKKVCMIKEWPLATQSKQKAYIDHKRWDLEFSVGDHVFLQVLSMKGHYKEQGNWQRFFWSTAAKCRPWWFPKQWQGKGQQVN